MKAISSVITFGVLLSLSSISHAKFFVDYQGLDGQREEAKKQQLAEEAAEKARASFKSDYIVLADKSLAVLEQIGVPRPTNTSVFGADMTLKDAMILIMPEDWIAYIHKDLKDISNVDFTGNEKAWTKVLANIGINYGYRFLVDWDKEQIQVLTDPTFERPDYNAPVAYKDGETGRVIYVYSENPEMNSDKSSLMIDGEAVPVKFED